MPTSMLLRLTKRWSPTFRLAGRNASFNLMTNREETIMAWTTPTLVEICVGLEINGYLPAEF